jgi:hypothetical protein
MRRLEEALDRVEVHATFEENAAMDAAILKAARLTLRSLQTPRSPQSSGGRLLLVKRVASLSAGGLPFRSEPCLGRGEARYESQEVQGQGALLFAVQTP